VFSHSLQSHSPTADHLATELIHRPDEPDGVAVTPEDPGRLARPVKEF